MKRFVAVVLVLAFSLLSMNAAFAEGDKNRGDKGQGDTKQHQIRK